MLRNVIAPVLGVLLTASPIMAQDAAELAAWDLARESGASAEVFAFIEKYPNSQYITEAKSVMIDLLWVELATTAPEAPTEEVAVQEAVPVTFSAPITEGSEDIIGKSLEQLIAGTPLFPPVEGLPEEYWKTQECSSCHEWQQANLCTQANSYLSDAGAENLIKQHPYGGTFKLNLRNWAQNDCG